MLIYDDNVRLDAVLDMPEGNPEQCPLVIVIHGFTGYKEERHIEAVSRTMNEMGYATLRVDMYGHGQSDGEFRNHTLGKWISNAIAVIDYACTLPFVTDLYLCGHSQGGLLVILAAALKHDLLSGLILLAPAAMIPDIAREGNFLGFTFDPDHIPDEIDFGDGTVLSGNYMRVAQMIDVDAAIERYDGPVLVIHSDTDEAVPFQCGVDVTEAYQNAELVVIPNDTHCYDNHLDMVLEALRAWLPPAA